MKFNFHPFEKIPEQKNHNVNLLEIIRDRKKKLKDLTLFDFNPLFLKRPKIKTQANSKEHFENETTNKNRVIPKKILLTKNHLKEFMPRKKPKPKNLKLANTNNNPITPTYSNLNSQNNFFMTSGSFNTTLNKTLFKSSLYQFSSTSSKDNIFSPKTKNFSERPAKTRRKIKNAIFNECITHTDFHKKSPKKLPYINKSRQSLSLLNKTLNKFDTRKLKKQQITIQEYANKHSKKSKFEIPETIKRDIDSLFRITPQKEYLDTNELFVDLDKQHEKEQIEIDNKMYVIDYTDYDIDNKQKEVNNFIDKRKKEFDKINTNDEIIKNIQFLNDIGTLHILHFKKSN